MGGNMKVGWGRIQYMGVRDGVLRFIDEHGREFVLDVWSDGFPEVTSVFRNVPIVQSEE
jgi:hypothetical protein